MSLNFYCQPSFNI